VTLMTRQGAIRRSRLCRHVLKRVAYAAMFAVLPWTIAPAQTAAEFYRGKTIDLYINSSIGGGYDLYARTIARHLGRHLPGNPTILPKNMEGGGGMRLANWLYNVGPKDGTVIGAVTRAMPFEPLLGNKAALYDARRFNYIGSANDEVSVCAAWHTAGIKTFEDAQQRPLIVGSSGIFEDTYQYPTLLNRMFGAKFKIVLGYPGGNDVNLAMERGEVQGRCSIPWSTVKASRRSWIDENKVSLLLQYSLGKHADLPNVPLVMDLAKTAEEETILKLIFGRQVLGRPFVAPPGVPNGRVAVLRKAFMETMADAEFLTEAEKAKLEVTPVAGEKLESLVLEVYRNTTPALAAKAGAMMR
jgi:tripartite-type tricarboxylate transporter receptor subunit TctC